ncbi:hypothetical protein G6F44_011439 [Rhizopus delemar]|nr:hypothetical protein G6F44_011439 [Rhizopus delemar]
MTTRRMDEIEMASRLHVSSHNRHGLDRVSRCDVLPTKPKIEIPSSSAVQRERDPNPTFPLIMSTMLSLPLKPISSRLLGPGRTRSVPVSDNNALTDKTRATIAMFIVFMA